MRPFAKSIDLLRDAGLRPTRQRMALAKLLFDHEDRHVTAEVLHAQARDEDIKVSLATVYNTLNQFRDAGLVREVVVEPGRSYFDTNVDNHHHFFNVDNGELSDIPLSDVSVSSLPVPPEGTAIDRVDVVVRVSKRA
ncbi:MAG: Fur family transcriptional regulator [Alphaproteobacteria bacterium]